MLPRSPLPGHHDLCLLSALPWRLRRSSFATNPPYSSPDAGIYIKYVPKVQNPVLKIIFLPGEHFIVLIIFTACPTDARSCCLEMMVFCSFSLGKPDFFAFDKLKYHSARPHPSVFPLHRGGIFLLLPRVSDQNIAYLVFMVLGKKLLLHLYASSFPECME